MYLEEYKRWLAADLEDADLNPGWHGLKETMRRSRTVLLYL